jgi:Uncharacterised protein family (UPF0236)
VYGNVPERVKRLLGIEVNESQTYRSCQRVAEAIDEIDIIKPTAEMQKLQSDEKEVTYAMVDGSMIQLDGGWQEVKVGRVFKATQVPDIEEFAWKMGVSSYVAKRGHYLKFTEYFEQQLPPSSQCKKVFVTDAAQWICQWIADTYPKAVHILDLFHVSEKLAAVAPKDGGVWLEKQKASLLESNVDSVIRSLKKLSKSGIVGVENLVTHIEIHKSKMDYKLYRENGWMIGSGPIESAHRTVLQVRMKRSGQRWADAGCDNAIKLRVLYKNDRAYLVKNVLRHAA